MASTSVRPVSRKYAPFHAHGCTRCGRRYRDGCAQPRENAVCTSCRSGQVVPLWDRNAYPQDCCLASSVLITDVVVLNSYGLAGPGPWLQCRTCKRTHPYTPGGATHQSLVQLTQSRLEEIA